MSMRQELEDDLNAKDARIKALEGEIRKWEIANRHISDAHVSEGLRADKAEAKLSKAVEALENFGEHDRDCLCSQFRAGRPTKDGGYESLYGHGKQERWYQRNECPKCSCGLTETLTEIKEKK